MDAQQTRRAEISLIYEGKDISRNIAPYMMSFTYTDNSGDKADDISITLEDRDRLWIGDWFPSKGDKVRASIIIHDWEQAGTAQSLPCGLFEVDQIECSGPPNQVTIKAVSTLVSKPMRQEKHTKAWENVKLSTIAGDAASRSGLALFWDSKDDPYFERRDQVETSDLEFLAGLCRDYGIAVKVTDTQLVCYDEEEYEAHTAVGELAFGDMKLIRWSFSTKTAGTYKSARLQYHDPVKDETYSVTEDGDAEGTGRVLELNQKADSESDARKIASESLRQANKREITANITLMGDLRFVGGSNLTITGFGTFDGKYVIEKATHTVSGSYTTKLDLRMGGESKKAASKKKSAVKAKAKKRAKSLGSLIYTGDNVYRTGKAVLDV
ncbi:MAG: hypothetical protein IJP89_06920 [Synergistaceae bacterium]|nr:hypothetical protein [Synergistaceae bacterium]